VWRYSYSGDKGVFSTRVSELLARFPLAEHTGGRGLGIPYSVFLPVDNMARYWYDQFLRTGDILALGPVMHAIQDASVPHHAAGYMGNWHGRYETHLGRLVPVWLADSVFLREVRSLVTLWDRVDPTPPTTLGRDDWRRTPGINWTVDQLVTWVALHSFREYDRTYHHFRGGYRFVADSARDLTRTAMAVCVLVLRKAALATEPSLNYNLVARAPYALWSNDLEMNLPFQGSDVDSRGFARVRDSARMEDGRAHTNVLQMHPRWAANTTISGAFHLLIPPRATFTAKIGFLEGATGTDGVTFTVTWIPLRTYAGPPPPTIVNGYLGRWTARYDRALESVEVDLTHLAGQRGLLLLLVSSGPSSGQDWAAWVAPVVRSGRP
jgi:hypothetical protein